VLEQPARLKTHALDCCTRTGRPYEYLANVVRKEEMARKIAERDEIKQGLVCVLSVVEPCRTFSLAWNGRSPRIRDAKRKCLHLYYYFIDPELGLIHAKVQTWFPFRIQVYVNGHEWLARRMDRQQRPYLKLDNAFLRVSDLEQAQRLANGFERVDWVHVLDGYAIQVNPLLGRGEILAAMRRYWVTDQAEYSTDVLFRRRADLEALMPRLCQYATLYFACQRRDDVSRAQADRPFSRRGRDRPVPGRASRQADTGPAGKASGEVQLDQAVRPGARATGGDGDQQSGGVSDS